MPSRVIESPTAVAVPQPTDKQVHEALIVILRCLQRSPSSMFDLPEFKLLAGQISAYFQVPQVSSRLTPEDSMSSEYDRH